MKHICKNCYYWCWDFIRANNGDDAPYDYSYSFCGLHGRREIDNPSIPQSYDFLNGGINDRYPDCRCGFFPKNNQIPIQLSLFPDF